MRCLAGVQRGLVGTAVQLRIPKERLLGELAPRLGMLSTEEGDLRRGMARVAGHARKRATRRKREDPGDRRLILDNFSRDPNMWGSVRRMARKGGRDIHMMPLEGKVLLNQAEALSLVYRDRNQLQGTKLLIRLIRCSEATADEAVPSESPMYAYTRVLWVRYEGPYADGGVGEGKR